MTEQVREKIGVRVAMTGRQRGRDQGFYNPTDPVLEASYAKLR